MGDGLNEGVLAEHECRVDVVAVRVLTHGKARRLDPANTLVHADLAVPDDRVGVLCVHVRRTPASRVGLLAECDSSRRVNEADVHALVERKGKVGAHPGNGATDRLGRQNTVAEGGLTLFEIASRVNVVHVARREDHVLDQLVHRVAQVARQHLRLKRIDGSKGEVLQAQRGDGSVAVLVERDGLLRRSGQGHVVRVRVLIQRGRGESQVHVVAVHVDGRAGVRQVHRANRGELAVHGLSALLERNDLVEGRLDDLCCEGVVPRSTGSGAGDGGANNRVAVKSDSHVVLPPWLGDYPPWRMLISSSMFEASEIRASTS